LTESISVKRMAYM